MAVVVTHSKTLVAPDSGAEDKVYGSDYIAGDSHVVAGLAAVAESNDYADLSGLPTLGTAASTAHTNYATAAQGATADAAQPGDAQLTALAGLSYAGNALKTIRVVATEDGFELATASAAVAWGAITGTVLDQTDISTQFALTTHAHSASDITSSTLNLARLGSGTYNASTFMRGTSTFAQPSFSSLANMPTLGTAASTSHLDYASSTHNISSATHSFPGGTNVFLRGDGTFATPAGGTSNMSTVVKTALQSSTTTSTLPVTSLAFTVSNTIAYKFEFGVIYAAVATGTGIKFSLTGPAVSSFTAAAWIPQGIAVAGTIGEMRGNITSMGYVVSTSTTPIAAGKFFAEIKGAILPSANGTLQLTYATEVAGSAVSTFAGSYGVLTTL